MPLETEVAPAPEVDAGLANGGISIAPPPATRSSARPSLASWLESHALFIAAVAAVVVVSLASIPAHLSQDGWLALVAGRIIAQHGLPHHDYLTVMAHGVRWNDQQWLAQLVMYELYRLGGLALLTVLYVLLTGVAFAMGIAGARRLGADDRHVTAILPVGAFFYLATAVSIRTQGLAYPLFVGLVWLLACEVRQPTRRVYLIFPILILWGNLHGSVTLGAGIAFLYGACLLAEGFRTRRWSALRSARAWAIMVGSPLCLLITPYGLSIVSYYKATLFNSQFSKLVAEWQPVTAYMVLAVPLLVVMVGTIWALGRSGRRTPLFNQLVLMVLALGAVDAVRNITWFGLALVILMPATLTSAIRSKPVSPRRHRVNVTVAGASTALILMMVATTLAHPASWFERTYPRQAVSAVRGLVQHDPSAKVFADVRFADWLVWHDSRLAGRIAYDTSFENLTLGQLRTLNQLGEALLPGQRDPLAGYSVLVLDPKNKETNRILLRRTHARVVLRNKRVVIATKSASA